MRQWWKLSTDLALAGFEAQRVIALRLAKLAAGGPAADREARRMVTEKIAASTEAAATLATGGMMTDRTAFPVDNKDNGEGIGPGFRGTVAKPNDVRAIKAGDVIIIPKGMPHWFTEIPENLTYLVVRIDPEKSTVLK